MFLGIYRFEGNADQLLVGYQKMMELVPKSAIHLHICIRDSRGLSVFDSCPTREVFEKFSGGDDFLGLVRMAGLPAPTVTPIGEIESAWHEGERLM